MRLGFAAQTRMYFTGQILRCSCGLAYKMNPTKEALSLISYLLICGAFYSMTLLDSDHQYQISLIFVLLILFSGLFLFYSSKLQSFLEVHN